MINSNPDRLAERVPIRVDFGGDPLRLARGLVLLPNNRAKRAIQDAFVRASEGGLLLPRLVAVGDPELDEAVFDRAADEDAVPPAVDPLQRRMILARLIQEAGSPVDAAAFAHLRRWCARKGFRQMPGKTDARSAGLRQLGI